MKTRILVFLLIQLLTTFTGNSFSQTPIGTYIDKEKGICYDSPDWGNIEKPKPIKIRPYLITIDGMSPSSTYLPSWPDMPTIDIYEALVKTEEYKKFTSENGMAMPLSWSRDIKDSDKTVEKLYRQIKWLNERNLPVSIISHSWGTVISYIALKKHPDIYIERLVTLGSPLSSQNSAVFAITRAHLAVREIYKIEKLNNVGEWSNFFIGCDPIASKLLDIIPSNLHFTSNLVSGGDSECHRSYFEKNSGIWNTVMKKAFGYKVNIRKIAIVP